MNSNDVTVGLAFIAGFISFISPCVLPLVPAYIGYMGGRVTQQVSRTQMPDRRGLGQRFDTFTHGLFFVLGFTIFFVVFGLLTTAAVSSLTSFGVTEGQVKDAIARLGGTVVVLFGLHVMGILNGVFTWLLGQMPKLDRSRYGNVMSTFVAIALIGLIYWLFMRSWFLTLVVILLLLQIFRDALKAESPGDFWSRILVRIQTAFYADTRRQTQPQSRYGYLGSMFMGVVFSAGWTPCIGPIYLTVLTMASSGESVPEAGVMMVAYSLGLGVPFLLTALALDRAQGVFRHLQRRMRTIEAFSGLFLIVIGMLVFSGQLQRLSAVGGQGSLGSLSSNMESCVVGLFRGEIRFGNVTTCIGDGPKEEFYVTAPKVVAEAPAANDATFSEGPSAETGGLNVPSLDDSTGLSAPEIGSSPTDSGSASVPIGLEVGQRAPNFSAQTLDGQTVSLSDYQGKMVLLNFWATWCTPCKEEMSDFQTLYETQGSDSFVVLAVDNILEEQSRDDVVEFVDDLGLTFPVVLDTTGEIRQEIYGSRIQGYPTSFLINQDGVIIDYFPGQVDGGKVLEALEQVRD